MTVLLALGMGAGLGCRGNPSTPVVDSESHWLERCDTSETCGAFDCVCGICTVPCEDDCGGSGAICSAPPGLCDVPAGGLCTAPCAVDADCVRPHLACVDAACLPIASPDPGDGGAPPDVGPADMSPSMDMALDGDPADAGSGGDMAPDMAPVDGLPPVDMAADVVPDMAPDMSPPDAAPPVEGECAHPDSVCFDDGQCPDGVCSAGVPDGPCVCVAPGPAIERVMCADGACCEDADCPAAGELDGRCQAEGLAADNAMCGAEPMANLCVVESCLRDVDCGPGKTCVRPGEYGHAISACVDATCASDADCVGRDDGRCTPFLTPCYVRGFHCTYDGDVCRADADCPQRGAGQVCQPRAGGRGTECVEVP